MVIYLVDMDGNNSMDLVYCVIFTYTTEVEVKKGKKEKKKRQFKGVLGQAIFSLIQIST